ncbi:MAG: class D sortase [Lachnospiraceae bacterium]|nr:class D sortase [Lachnospiraceae bacterium]
MPLFFSILTYGIVYLMTSDMISLATSVSRLIISDSEPDFTIEYKNVFNPGEVEADEDNTIKYSEVPKAQYGDLYAYVKCETIGLDCPVYMGDDNDILKLGAGQVPATYQPGFGRFIMLGAHNNTFFNCLKNIQLNDILTMETSYGIYTYQVVSTEVLDVTGMDAYDFLTDHEQLILYTCYPFDMLSHTDYRFIVHADLISGPEIVND